MRFPRTSSPAAPAPRAPCRRNIGPAAGLVDNPAPRRHRPPPACAAPGCDKEFQIAAADRAVCPSCQTSICVPASRGAEPLTAARVTSAQGSPVASSSAARAHRLMARPRQRWRSSSTANRMRSGVAGASSCGTAVLADAGDRVAERMEHRDGQHQRRLAHRLGAMDGLLAVAPVQSVMLKAAGGRCRPGSCRWRAHGWQPAWRVEHQLLGGQPAHALNEAAFDLAEVDGRVQRAADSREGCRRARPVSRRSACRSTTSLHGRAVRKIIERPAAMGRAVVVDLRRSCRSRWPTARRGAMGRMGEFARNAANGACRSYLARREDDDPPARSRKSPRRSAARRVLMLRAA